MTARSRFTARSVSQPNGLRRRPSHVSRGAITVLVVAFAVLAGCGGGPGHHQAVPGKFVRVGGPPPGAPVPLPGTITARAATGGTFTATAGKDGRFTLSLPPGTYRVTGAARSCSPGRRSAQRHGNCASPAVNPPAPSPCTARFPSRPVTTALTGHRRHAARRLPRAAKAVAAGPLTALPKRYSERTSEGARARRREHRVGDPAPTREAVSATRCEGVL